MTIFLTDFGAADIYVGQVKAVVLQCAPRVRVIDVVHEATCRHLMIGCAATVRDAAEIGEIRVSVA